MCGARHLALRLPVRRDLCLDAPVLLGGGGLLLGMRVLQSKRLLIESRWVSKPLAFAGKLRLRRLNK
jgi:hypothetical protein